MSYCSPYDKTSFLYYVDENKLFSGITFFTFAVIGVFWYILRCYSFFEKHKIPRAVTPSAPYGNIKDILFRNTTMYVFLWKYYNKFKRKGYKFAGFYLFFKPGILAVHPSLTFKILSDDRGFDNVSRKKNVLDYKKVLRMFDDSILQQLIESSNAIKPSLEEQLAGKTPLKEVLYGFLAESSCLTFGFNKGSADVLIKSADEKIRSGFWHYLKLVLSFTKSKSSNEDLRNFIKDVCGYRKKHDVREKDLLQCFTDTLRDDRESEGIIDEIIEIAIENIIYSCSTVLFCLYELASNPDIQDDLIGEIRRFNKNNSTINLDNLHHLIYLEAVVKETLRKYPPVPLVTKKPKKDYNMNDFGLDLPKSCLIFATIFGVHHDPANFPDPEAFDPDRFFEDNIKYIKPNTYFPFGLDSRNTIGFRLTNVHVELCIFNILSSFRVDLTKKDHVLEFDNDKLVTYPKEPLPLRFELLTN
ncbi:probable cytochrome P450 6d4 isoform X1 [Leptinotarsa decemlineata]|uniref:probable cytochrome P450 6d4 isoform X1 n=1 Tax=Leptinotarsa decemlineata TaxID=7539 RepID=UPI003D304498